MENCLAHGADNVECHLKLAPDGLDKLPDPNAVFIGGSRGQLETIIRTSYQRLKLGGRLVINAITMANISETQRILDCLPDDYDVSLVQISRSKNFAGKHKRYDALNPIHIFKVEKTQEAPT